MGTVVFLHAHPDDEVIQSGGSMARAADEGHRVVLVVATGGEHGEVPDDLADGENLVARRRVETERSAAILGVQRVAWLGYRDSGMAGWPQNDEPGAFSRAGVDEVASRVAAILEAERADVLVGYDWHGLYGHPDHIQVHRVARRARELAGTPRLLESTFNRDAMKRSAVDGPVGPDGEVFDPEQPMDDGNPLGTPEAELHLAVDVGSVVPRKRAAIACHASQVTDTGMFLAMSEDEFTSVFSTEWFIEPDATSGLRAGWLFEVTGG